MDGVIGGAAAILTFVARSSASGRLGWPAS